MRDDPAFRQFLKDIDDHVVHVLGEVLRWKVLERPQYMVGSGNVVLRLRTDAGSFIFRVPRYSQLQLRRIALAYRHFGSSGLMPERIHFDGKCVLERFVPGLPLSARAGEETLRCLGRALATLHALPASGFGVLSHASCGHFDDAAHWLADEPATGFAPHPDDAALSDAESDAMQALLAAAAQPPAGLHGAPCCVCHGDLWRRNVLAGPEGLWLIDWDQIGAYPREWDFFFLVDADLSPAQKALVLGQYPHALDPELLRWFALRRLIAARGMDRREQLALAARHRLLDAGPLALEAAP